MLNWAGGGAVEMLFVSLDISSDVPSSILSILQHFLLRLVSVDQSSLSFEF